MRNVERLVRRYIEGGMDLPAFQSRLNEECESARANLRSWWRSQEAFERVWDDLGGFDEAEYERRVNDAFDIEYTSIVRRALQPILKKRVLEIPEYAALLKQVEPFLLSDSLDRVRKAETIEDVFYALGDDLKHWLIAILAPSIRYAARKTSAA